MFNGRILVATDGSASSEKAVELAAQLAHKVGPKLTAVTVAAPYPYTPSGSRAR